VPFTRFLIKTCMYYGVHLSQMSPQSLSRLSHYEITCRAFDVVPDLFVFRAFYRLTMAGDWYTFEKRRQCPLCVLELHPTFVPGKPVSFMLMTAVFPLR
jgi:hypothetical protein